MTGIYASQPAPELLFRDWVQGPDIRQQSVASILQTRDGYLWIGTSRGFVRFDGVDFTAFNSTNTAGMKGDDMAFNALFEDERGAIWGGTDSHGVVVNDHGHFRTLQKAEGLPDLQVLRIDSDETGAIWIYTLTGVRRWSHDRLEEVHPERDGSGAGPLIPFSDRRTIDFAKMGLWRHASDGLERFAYGRWALFPTPPGDRAPLEQTVRNIYEDHLHRIWYTTGSPPGRYFCAQAGGLRTFNGLPPASFAFYRDRAGFIWINDHNGNAALWKDGSLYPLPGLHAPYFLNVMELPDGTAWAGSMGTQLFHFRPRRIDFIPTPGAPETGSVLFQQRSGEIWAGGTDLLHAQPGKYGFLSRPNLTRGDMHWVTIYALSEDNEGELLVASRGVEGIEVLRGKTLVPYVRSGSIDGVVHALLLSASGDQWVGTTAGLYCIRKADRVPMQMLKADVLCLAEPTPGSIWAGTEAGPVLVQNQHHTEFKRQPEWKFGAVWSISSGSDGIIWMATPEHGIVGYAGSHFHAFGSADGLPTDQILSVNAQGVEDLWLRTKIGLIRVRRNSLERRIFNPANKLQIRLFDKADGLPSVEMVPIGNQGMMRGPGGILWFASAGGIARVNPDVLTGKPASPHTVIAEHAIDQSDLLPGDSIVLHPQNNLELHYTALGSEYPAQLKFRYKLDGFDTDWVFAGNRRVAYYTHLPPGQFTFEVEAADDDADFSAASRAEAMLQVLTPFYRSWWFRTFISGLLIVAVFVILEARRRLERARSRMRQAFTHRLITTQEGERKRIAHELHDSLGQHLVLIRTLAMLPVAPVITPAGDHLFKIADQAAVAIDELQAISYNLRPYQLDRLGLTKAVMSLVRDVEASHSLKARHTIEDVDGFFPKDLEINFYRIVQEALNNVLKHSRATEVAVKITRTDDHVQMMVSDNGRGFSHASQTSHSAGLGLIGIQERAEALGGYAVIESSRGAGTKILVEVKNSLEPAEGEKK